MAQHLLQTYDFKFVSYIGTRLDLASAISQVRLLCTDIFWLIVFYLDEHLLKSLIYLSGVLVHDEPGALATSRSNHTLSSVNPC